MSVPKYISPTVVSNVCFLGDTLISTDQGDIAIMNLSSFNTIRGKSILEITKTTTLDKELVHFESNSIGNHNATTLSKTHLVYYQGTFQQASELTALPNVYYVPYQGELLYNIIMETHDIIIANQMICESYRLFIKIETSLKLI